MIQHPGRPFLFFLPSEGRLLSFSTPYLELFPFFLAYWSRYNLLTLPPPPFFSQKEFIGSIFHFLMTLAETWTPSAVPPFSLSSFFSIAVCKIVLLHFFLIGIPKVGRKDHFFFASRSVEGRFSAFLPPPPVGEESTGASSSFREFRYLRASFSLFQTRNRILGSPLFLLSHELNVR